MYIHTYTYIHTSVFRHARTTRAVAGRTDGRTRTPPPPLSKASLKPSRVSDGERLSGRDLSLLSVSLLHSIPGSIPAFYREVYEKICSPTNGNVKLEVFRSLLVKSQLNGSVVSQVSFYISILLSKSIAKERDCIHICNQSRITFFKLLST